MTKKNLLFVLLTCGMMLVSCGEGTSTVSEQGSETASEIESVSTHEHATTSEWQNDETNHWHVCDECQEHYDVAQHNFGEAQIVEEASCTKVGSKKYTCETCGYVKTEQIDKTAHEFSSEWTTSDTQHWHECACGEKSGVGDHQWDEGQITTAPGCTTKGEKLLTCTVCGKTKTVEVDATGHTEVADTSKNKAATYYEAGWEGATKCDVCGDPIAAGHEVARKTLNAEVTDLANPTSESLQIGIAEKIKYADQCNEGAVEGGTFRYVTAKKGENDVEALYFSKLTNDWDAEKDGEMNYGFSEFRFATEAAPVTSISFDYRLVDLNGDEVCTTIKEGDKSYGFKTYVEKKTSTYVRWTADSEAPNALVNDAQWHNYSLEGAADEVMSFFTIKIYHFYGEILISNIDVHYVENLDTMFTSKSVANKYFETSGKTVSVDPTNKSITLDVGYDHALDEGGHSFGAYLAITNQFVRSVREAGYESVGFHVDVESKYPDTNLCERYAIVTEKGANWQDNYTEKNFDPNDGFDLILDFAMYDLAANPNVYLNMTFRQKDSSYDNAPVLVTLSNFRYSTPLSTATDLFDYAFANEIQFSTVFNGTSNVSLDKDNLSAEFNVPANGELIIPNATIAKAQALGQTLFNIRAIVEGSEEYELITIYTGDSSSGYIGVGDGKIYQDYHGRYVGEPFNFSLDVAGIDLTAYPTAYLHVAFRNKTAGGIANARVNFKFMPSIKIVPCAKSQETKEVMARYTYTEDQSGLVNHYEIQFKANHGDSCGFAKEYLAYVASLGYKYMFLNITWSFTDAILGGSIITGDSQNYDTPSTFVINLTNEKILGRNVTFWLPYSGGATCAEGSISMDVSYAKTDDELMEARFSYPSVMTQFDESVISYMVNNNYTKIVAHYEVASLYNTDENDNWRIVWTVILKDGTVKYDQKNGVTANGLDHTLDLSKFGGPSAVARVTFTIRCWHDNVLDLAGHVNEEGVGCWMNRGGNALVSNVSFAA